MYWNEYKTKNESENRANEYRYFLESNFVGVYDQPVHSDKKRYEKIRKLAAGQGEDCTTGCLFNYEYIKNHYRLIVVDLNRQKELDAGPKAI